MIVCLFLHLMWEGWVGVLAAGATATSLPVELPGVRPRGASLGAYGFCFDVLFVYKAAREGFQVVV